MSEFFEIAYAAASQQLCLFTGTGFSKAVSDNAAPSWQGLLEAACDKCENPVAIRETLFPAGGPNPLGLEEAAQVISIGLSKVERSIHDDIAEVVRQIQLKGDNSTLLKFLQKNSFRVVTTNYDKLMEELCGATDCQSLAPGLPIPRSSARVKVYHVHGSIDVPTSMVVTSDDYFKFFNSQSYFSRKLSTVLHENTVIILGYSLGDTNLKAIISDYKGFSRAHFVGSNIFLVSRSVVDKHIKDYYAHCYGIRVLDNLSVHDFFKQLTVALPEATASFGKSLSNIKKVIYEKHDFTDKYLGLEMSFYEIVASLGAIGLSIDDPRVVEALGKVIKKKVELTHEDGAWTQYEHLSRWLIYLASILELKGSSIEGIFLDATLRSMNSMSNKLLLGYSWHAYRAWSNKWDGIIAANRTIIKKYVVDKSTWPDALSIVNRG